ncbi:MAG: hypothetical protein IJK31_10070 [Ruminococcus sp.]|nr:hypothetical protein [Ruminococcus sp.]
MKKTKATALTAAVLAAAMSAAACGNVTQAGEKEEEQFARPLSNKIVVEGNELNAQTETTTYTYVPTTTIPTLYGPPSIWDFEKDGQITTEDPSINEEDPTDPYNEEDPTDPYFEDEDFYKNPGFEPTTALPAPLYGPPPIEISGDIDYDGKVDAFDLTLMKINYNDPSFPKYYLYDDRYDVNNDGTFDIKDIEAVNKYLTGEIKTFDEYEDVTEPPTEDIEPTTAEPTEFQTYTTTVPLYGPPWVFGLE